MQFAHAIDGAATPHGKISHVEAFGGIIRILPAQRHQIVKRYGQFFGGIATQVLLDERRCEQVKTGGHRGVGGEDIARPRHG